MTQRAYAANITVDGVTCTLDNAITAANTDRATGGCPAGSGADTLTLTADTGAPQLAITSDMIIQGDNANRVVSGGGGVRIFYVGGGNVTFRNLTIRDGKNAGADGGAGSGGGGGALGAGGGLYVDAGAVTIENVTFANNRAVGGGGGRSTGYDGYGGVGAGAAGGGGGAMLYVRGGDGGDGGFGSGGGGGGGGKTFFSGGWGGLGGLGGFGGGGGGGGWGQKRGGPGAPGGWGGGTGGFGPNSGGGGAGLGGAIFIRTGSLNLINNTFQNNTIEGGIGAYNGGATGGAIFICTAAQSSQCNATAKGMNNTFANNCVTIYGSCASYDNVYGTITAPNPVIGVSGRGATISSGATTPATANGTDFGSLPLGGSPVVNTFTINNSSGTQLTLSGAPIVAVSGANASDFVVTQPAANSVAANSSTTFQISFTPKSAGVRKATVTIASNASNPSYTFALQGTATASSISVTGNNVQIPSGSATPATANGTDLGGAQVSGSAVVKTFTINNPGNAPLTLSSTPLVMVSGANASDFTITQPAANSVAAGGSTTFQISLTPQASGVRTATISIASNASATPNYTFAVQGRGFAPSLVIPTMERVVVNDGKLRVPVQFAGNGSAIASLGFAVNYDTACLSLDPTDGDGDGVPDAITGLDQLPVDFVTSVSYKADSQLLEVALYDNVPPIRTLSDSTLFVVTFSIAPACLPAPNTTKPVTVSFAPNPTPTFGDPTAKDVAGTISVGAITMYAEAKPTALTLDNNRVVENSAGATVGVFSSRDSEPSATFSYSLVSGAGSDDNASFTLANDTLKTVASFDYETKRTYTIRVRTTDNYGGSLEQSFVITVTDVNEAPTTLTLSNNTVAENRNPGAPIGQFTTTDPDGGETFSYSLVDGNGSADNASFALDNNTLTTNAIFDYETKNSYTIRVRTTDRGGLFTEQSFVINVTNISEAPTGIVNAGDGPSSDGSQATFDVNEKVAAGTAVATLAPANPDFSTNYTYNLVSGAGSSDNASFFIVNGVLKTTTPFDYETKSSYTIRVRITDSLGNSAEQILTIQINDMPDTPPVAVDDVVDPRTTVFLGGVPDDIDVLANDLSYVLGKTLNIASVTQPSQGSATYSPLKVTYTAPASGNGNTTFTYQATDGALTSNSATVSLNYVANDARGDCNGNGTVAAADFIGTVLEIFDTKNTAGPDGYPAWWLSYTGDYPGSPRGCDSNASGNPVGANGHPQASVTAADIICSVLIFFGHPCGNGVQAAQGAQAAQVAVADALASPGAPATLTVTLNTGGNAVAAATFALNLDPANLHFADTDADHDGIPDAITLNVPTGMTKVVTWNAALHRLEVAVFGMSLPLPTLTEGVLARVQVQVTTDAANGATPLVLTLVSLSDSAGSDLLVTQTNGTFTVQGGTRQADPVRTGLFLPLVVR